MALDFTSLLKNVLPGLINTGAAYYGAKQQAGATQDAAQATMPTPLNISSNVLGTGQFNPATGTYATTSPGAPAAPYYGAAPELTAALQGLTNTDAATSERLGQLRQLAAPEEQLAGNALENKLFSRGQLGGTGGALQQEALAKAQSQADLQRQMTAADWAQNRALTRFQGALSTVGQGQSAQAQQAQQAAQLTGLGIQGGRAQNPSAALAAAQASGDPLKTLSAALSQAGGSGGISGGLGSILSGVLGGGQGSGGIGDILGGILGGGSKASSLFGASADALGGGAVEGAGAAGSSGGLFSSLSSLFGGGGGAEAAPSAAGALGGGGGLSELGAGLGGSSALAGAGILAALPVIWNNLGQKASPGTNSFTSPENWDASKYSQWTPAEQAQYQRAMSMTPEQKTANTQRVLAQNKAASQYQAPVPNNSPSPIVSTIRRY